MLVQVWLIHRSCLYRPPRIDCRSVESIPVSVPSSKGNAAVDQCAVAATSKVAASSIGRSVDTSAGPWNLGRGEHAASAS